jgi:hypothetical protein
VEAGELLIIGVGVHDRLLDQPLRPGTHVPLVSTAPRRSETTEF